MANKISTVVEFATESAKSSLSSLKSSISEADGVGGKFKAGFASIKQSVSDNAGALSVVAGGALVAFGLKAVEAFEHTALAARDLGTATGLTVEDASRWIGVAKDMGVNADSLTAGLGKVGKTLTDVKWADFGIATKTAGGETRSVNDILLDTFDKLGKIRNQTDRAVEGNKLFGKGYATISPLIGKTREELQKYLGTVEKGQVITDSELKKAEAMHHAQEALKQAFGEVTLAVGQEVASFAPLIEGLAHVVSGIQGTETHKQLTDIFSALSPLGDEIVKSGKSIDYWIGQVQNGTMTIDQAKEAIHNATLSVVDLTASQKEEAAQTAETARETRKIPPLWEEVAAATDAATAAALVFKYQSDNTKTAVKQNIDEMIGKWDELTGNVNADKAWVTLEGSFVDLRTKFDEATTAIEKGTDDATKKTLDYKGALDDVTLSVIDYGKNVLGLPPEKLVSIKTALDAGDLQTAENQLLILTRNRNISISIQAKGGAGYGGLDGDPNTSFDEGGMVPGPTGAPMAATVHGGEMVLTPEQQRSVGGGGLSIGEVHVHVQSMPTANELVTILATYSRRNGPAALKALTS